MLVTIIIVTFNNEKTIRECLLSVDNYFPVPHEILIVDNNSSDQTIKIIDKTGIKVKLYSQKENFGFSKANNLAVEKARGEYLFFLNPDTKILNNHIEELFQSINNIPQSIIFAPQLVDEQGHIQPSVRKLPTLTNAVKEYLLGIKNVYEPYYPKTNQPVEVESVVGAAMIISKRNYVKLGGFNNKYFMYYEDLDFCRQVSQRGGKIIYFPLVRVEHKIGASASKNSQVRKYMDESFFRYHGFIVSLMLKLIFQIVRIKNFLK